MEFTYRPGLKEYGMALEIIGYRPWPTPEEITEGGRLVAFNFEMTQSAHPEWGLTNYRLVSGPSLEVWEYEECGTCGGTGIVAVDYGGAMSEGDCRECEQGLVAVKLADPPRWRHNFGWYSLGPDGPPPAR